jgi:septal ring factor EnvC (AmiA/AmiB activator)
MRDAVNVFAGLRAKGEELFGQITAELMANPRFLKAMETAFKGKAKFDEAVAQALKSANIPTRTEFKRALKRIDALERQLEELRAEVATLTAAAARPARRARARAGKPAARRKAKSATDASPVAGDE